ncbi:MAG: tyrosine-protein phosphatase [Anaerolineales bacterium]|nr:tyrosine-protein phosphatase [Anaerolineales bacterium]MCA9927666.1 tyrosine-protein phosphatase [Anaerolineales bacterium]
MKAKTDTIPHRLPLQGAYNVRDVGGYVTKDGRFLKPRTLIRADSLHNLTPADQQYLLDYGVRTIIDLRRSTEIEADPNVFADSTAVHYQNLPLHNGWKFILENNRPDNLSHLYCSILDNAPKTIHAVMTAVSTPNAFPLIVHCQIGKDRTGVLMALLLGVVGVPDETIIADYAYSRDFLDPILEKYRLKIREQGGDISLFDMLTQSPPEAMADTLAHLKNTYGGIRPYLLHHIGLTDFQLDTVQSQLLL